MHATKTKQKNRGKTLIIHQENGRICPRNIFLHQKKKNQKRKTKQKSDVLTCFFSLSSFVFYESVTEERKNRAKKFRGIFFLVMVINCKLNIWVSGEKRVEENGFIFIGNPFGRIFSWYILFAFRFHLRHRRDPF